jgi:hypothetical protein
MAHTHLHLLLTGNVGILDRWRIVFSNWNPAWILSLVFLRGTHEDENI